MRPSPSPSPPSRAARTGIAFAAACLAVGLAAVQHLVAPGGASDFDPVWYGARAILAGADPYAAVGPGRALDISLPLYYPATALVGVLPLALLPAPVARVAFVAVSAALLAYAVTSREYVRLVLFMTPAFFVGVLAAQWAPLLAAASLLPGLAWLLVAKPTIGAVYLASTPSPRVLRTGVVGGGILVLLSLVLVPGWPAAWWANASGATHFRVPLFHVGGALLLLALLRWRRPEAWLLLLLACVPQTVSIYETLPLFLIVRRRTEGYALVILSAAARGANQLLAAGASGPADLDRLFCRAMDAEVLLLFLPVLWMVLRRPNEGDGPAWLALAARMLPAGPRAVASATATNA